MKQYKEGGKESPDPLHGSVGMSAVWATMEEATLSPRAHMALLDGPGREQLNGKEKCPKNDFIILIARLWGVFYLETISQIYPEVQGVWDFRRHDPIQPTRPEDTETETSWVFLFFFSFL